MKTYEYMLLRGESYEEPDRSTGGEFSDTRHHDLTESELDESGADGWRAVSVDWYRGRMRSALMVRVVGGGT